MTVNACALCGGGAYWGAAWSHGSMRAAAHTRAPKQRTCGHVRVALVNTPKQLVSLSLVFTHSLTPARELTATTTVVPTTRSTAAPTTYASTPPRLLLKLER